MKLRLWFEIVLLILGSICFILLFHESLTISALACLGFIIVNIPIIKYGRLMKNEK